MEQRMACISEMLGERRREVMRETRKTKDLYRFEKSSWLTTSPSTEVMYDVLAKEEIDVEAGLAAVAD